MYLHLGQDVVVRTDEVVGIFDLEGSTLGKSTRQYLTLAEKQGHVVTITDELPRSFVVCRTHRKGEMVYLSQISPATLKRRLSIV